MAHPIEKIAAIKLDKISDTEKPQPFRCSIGFHKWGNWKKPYGVLFHEWQKRKCLRCNIVDERMV